MEKMLIALDYSPKAQKIAEDGYRIATAMRAKVTLLHVMVEATYYSSLNYSPILGWDSFSTVTESDSSSTLADAAESYLEEIKMHLGDESIETVVLNGDVKERILETSMTTSSDIIVMGSYGKSGLERFFLGSIADDVLHHTEIALLVIPAVTPG